MIASEKKADILVQVKGNQPTLLAACEDLARHRTATQCDVQHDKGHGRIETRTVHTFDLPQNWLPDGWQPVVQQVACRDCINSIVHASTGKVRLFAKATGRRNCPKCSTGKIAFTINDLHGISRRYPHASPHFMWISVRPDVSWAAARPLAHPN
jgi:hypothetical protein